MCNDLITVQYMRNDVIGVQYINIINSDNNKGLIYAQ